MENAKGKEGTPATKIVNFASYHYADSSDRNQMGRELRERGYETNYINHKDDRTDPFTVECWTREPIETASNQTKIKMYDLSVAIALTPAQRRKIIAKYNGDTLGYVGHVKLELARAIETVGLITDINIEER